jgi:hypothetical protein
MDFMIASPLMRFPVLSNIPDMAQPDGILICPSRCICVASCLNKMGVHHVIGERAGSVSHLMNALVLDRAYSIQQKRPVVNRISRAIGQPGKNSSVVPKKNPFSRGLCKI